jgi:glycosyltransferase involved in cell wall biosynthesis
MPADRPQVEVLVLGTADWNQPIATNQHYVVREMARADEASITFVESIGLRRPQFTARDLRRIAGRVTRRLRGDTKQASRRTWRPVPRGVSISSPLLIPTHTRILRGLNKWLLERSVRGTAPADAVRVLWTYSPVTYGLHSNADLTIYHCVDLLREVPGINPRLIDVQERELALTGAVAIATSPVVRDHLLPQGFSEVLLWENVADVQAIVARTEQSSRVSGRVIFAGNLSPTKIDYQLINALSRYGIDVVLAGPRAEGGGKDEMEFNSLVAAGATYLGILSQDELAQEMGKCTVGLIPYVLNDYTRGVSPLKVYEYLAAGLAVVSTEIPGVHATPSAIWLEPDAEGFVKRVASLAQVPTDEDIKRRRALAVGHSWAGRGADIRALLSTRVSELGSS